MPWYRRYHQKALKVMIRFTLEQRGAYNTAIDLIVSYNGPIPDDERWLSGVMNCSIRKWRILRSELLAMGALKAADHEDGPYLMDTGAILEVGTYASGRPLKLASGRARPRLSAENEPGSNEINGLEGDYRDREGDIDKKNPPPTLKGGHPLTPSAAEPPNGIRGEPAKSIKAQTYLPETWTVSEALYVFALEQGFERSEVDHVAAEYRDYWRSRRDAHARKADWDAVFRNRIRDLARAGRPGRGAPADPGRADPGSRRDAWARAAALSGGEVPDDESEG